MSDLTVAPRTGPARHASPGLVALGWRLARGGPGVTMSRISIGVGVLTTFAAVVVAVLVTESAGVTAPLHDIPSLAAAALAWGAGVMLAFAAGRHALRHDRDEGIRALVHARGGSSNAYLWGRVFGLVTELAIVVAGGTLVVSIACVALTTHGNVELVVRGGVASVVYALAFAATVGPIAMAALGARSRAGGYLWLLGVLVVPELVERWTAVLLPTAWRDVASIPSALSALRSSLMPPAAIDAAHLARAVVVLLIAAGGAILVLRWHLARLDGEGHA